MKCLTPASSRRQPFERLSYAYWDSVAVLNGNTTLDFTLFRDIATKTETQSNLKTSGQLGRPQQLKVYEIRVHVSLGSSLAATPVPRSPTDVQSLVRGVLTMTVQDSPMLEIPMWLLPSGAGICGDVALFATADTEFAMGNNGYPSWNAAYRLINPIVIVSNEQFAARLQYTTPAPNPAADARVFVMLHGLLRRGIL